MSKKKILFYCYFARPTGFGNVAENIVERLMDDYEIDVLAISYLGEPLTSKKHPYNKFSKLNVIPARDFTGMFGRQKLLDLLATDKYDYFFVIQDTFNMLPINKHILELKEKCKFKYILYFPVDGTFPKEWYESIEVADFPVTYTQFAVDTLGIDIPYIYHGVDKAFYPISEEERLKARKEYFGVEDDTFIVTNVNKNQPRKDIARTIITFFKFFEKVNGDAKLYLNCNPTDDVGVNLLQLIDNYYSEYKDAVIFPNRKMSKDDLRNIYNASDVLVSTTLGEGWGLSTTEAMACGLPIILPDNTTAKELLGDMDRGIFCKCTEPIVNMFDHSIIRYTTDVEDMVANLQIIYCNKDIINNFQRPKQLEFIKEYCDWDKIVKEWKTILDILGSN